MKRLMFLVIGILLLGACGGSSEDSFDHWSDVSAALEENGFGFNHDRDEEDLTLEDFDGLNLPDDARFSSGRLLLARDTEEEVDVFTFDEGDPKAFAQWVRDEDIKGALVDGATYAIIYGSDWLILTGPDTAPAIQDAIGGEQYD